MKYKVGDKVEFISNNDLLVGEIISIHKGLFKRYVIHYKKNSLLDNIDKIIKVRHKDIVCKDTGRVVYVTLDRKAVLEGLAPSRQR